MKSAVRVALTLSLACLVAGSALVIEADGATKSGSLTVGTGAPQRESLRLPLAAPRVRIEKARRRLTLYDGDRVVRVYRIALGSAPSGDKERQGDRRTPEGEFYVFTRNARSSFYLSLGLSYPNVEDAERGLRDGLITTRQRQRILSAHRRRIAPPQNTRLGGDIYIHGGGTGSDWTWGCVALDNEDVKELFDAVPVGTKVVIEP